MVDSFCLMILSGDVISCLNNASSDVIFVSYLRSYDSISSYDANMRSINNSLLNLLSWARCIVRSSAIVLVMAVCGSRTMRCQGRVAMASTHALTGASRSRGCLS